MATDPGSRPSPVVPNLALCQQNRTTRHLPSNIRWQMRFAALLKLRERRTFKASKHPAANMLIPYSVQ